MIVTLISIVLTSLLTLGLLAWYLRRTIPIILSDVGADIGEQFKEVFANPNVKRAFSILGTRSGDSRRESGAERALAEGLLSKVTPELRIILDQVAPNLIEDYGAETVLALVAKYGPMLKQYLPKTLSTGSNKENPYR